MSTMSGKIKTTEKQPKQGWQRTVTLFLVGQAITLFGTMITGYAISWYVTLQTQSGVILMLFTIAMMVPMAVSSPLGGVWADRYNRKYLINLVDAIIALVTLIMALFFSAGIQWIGLLFVCMVVRGFGQGIQMPTVTAILPDIVPPDQLVRVNGFNSAIQSLSTFASPIVAAGLLSFFPVQVLMFIDVATAAIGITIVFLFVQTHKGWRRSTATSLAISVPDQASSLVTSNDPLAETPARSSFFIEFKAGLRYMTSHKFILGFIVLGILFNILATPAALLTPLQVTRDFGADAWRLGAIEVVFSVGMMLGGLLMGIWGGFRNRTYTMALSTLFFGLGTIGLGIMGDFWLYLACIAFVGIIMPLFNAPMMGILQEKIARLYGSCVLGIHDIFGSLSLRVACFFGPLANAISYRMVVHN